MAIISGFNAYSTTIEDFARVDVGESRTIEIDGTGGYTVFYEPGVSDETHPGGERPAPTVTLTDPSGNPVTLVDYDSLGTYGSSGYVGIAIDTFQVPEPGRYELATSDQVLSGTIAVGRSPFHKIATRVAVGGAVRLRRVRPRPRDHHRAGGQPGPVEAPPPGRHPYVAPAWTGGPQPGYPQPGYPPQGYAEQPQYSQPQYPPQPQYPQPQQPTGPPPGPPPGGGQPSPGGFGPPPGPPARPPPPAAPSPVAPDDDSTPGWGQPQQ